MFLVPQGLAYISSFRVLTLPSANWERGKKGDRVVFSFPWRLSLTGEVVAAHIVRLGTLDQGPHLGLLQVVEVVVVGGAELGAHAPVVAGDDDAAAAGGHGGVDAVLDAQADLLDGVVQDGGVLVVTDAAGEDDAVGREHVLGAPGRVLRRAAGDQLGVVVVEQVLEDALVLVLGEDGIVGLQAILLEQGLVAEGLDVWW